ncbi:hypothetical protein I7X30_09080 [Capnocytophaga sp. 051621]|uniref:Lipoprotein n=1 Tax=Capnocytophaga periodontitidis TaxID=2795027 RepID=A0ABS0SN58_9FLAO|nr:hypothetical protein [Capnocytophaga periodontitidis]MBI1647208.1 hypothetical protein [Capnocytophaga periodontitidis]
MKEIMKFSLFVLFFAVVLVSCSKEKNEEPLQDLQNKSMTYKEFFETVSEQAVNFIPDEKVLLISYKLNKEDNTITLLSSIIAESSWGVGFDVAGKYENQKVYRNQKDNYTIFYVNNDGEDLEKTCNGVSNFKQLLSNYYTEGIHNYLVYVPDVKAFYLSKDLKELVDLKDEETLKQVNEVIKS